MARVSVCWSSPRQCDHFLSCVNGAGLPLGQVGETAMFYCNTCGKSPSPSIVILGDLDTPRLLAVHQLLLSLYCFLVIPQTA